VSIVNEAPWQQGYKVVPVVLVFTAANFISRLRKKGAFLGLFCTHFTLFIFLWFNCFIVDWAAEHITAIQPALLIRSDFRTIWEKRSLGTLTLQTGWSQPRYHELSFHVVCHLPTKSMIARTLLHRGVSDVLEETKAKSLPHWNLKYRKKRWRSVLTVTINVAHKPQFWQLCFIDISTEFRSVSGVV
jgi:hypothetical protein